MSTKSKMAEEGIRKKIKEQVRLLNTFLNMVDPAKDARVAFMDEYDIKTKLDEDIHGPFLVGLYRKLFNGNILPAVASAKLKGVGDGLGKVLRALQDILGDSLEQFSYDYSSLGYSANGDSAWRMHEMNFIIDTPIDLNRIGDATCKAVVGPFSILDKAPRQMAYPKERLIDLLGHPSTLPETFLADIGMDKSLGSISYQKEAGSYKFTFALKPVLVSPELPEQKVIRYDATFKTPDGYINNSTNSVRNSFVYDNYKTQDSTILKKMLFLILFKELGDTLQATWILQYIKDGVLADLRMENTALVSVDRGVLYRSVINGVGCLHTDHGAQCSSFYPRIGRPFKVKHGPLAGKTVDSEFMRKNGLFQSLIQHNKNILTIFKGNIAVLELAKLRVQRGEEANVSIFEWTDTFETMGLDTPTRKLREAIVVDVMLILLKSMLNYILPIIEHIETEMEGLAKSDDESASDYEKKVVKYKLSHVFSYEEKRSRGERRFRWSKYFTQFLKQPIAGLAKDGTNKFDLYNLSLLYKKNIPTQEQLQAIVFSEDTPLAQRIDLVPIDWKEPPRPAAPVAMTDAAAAQPLAGKRRERNEEEGNAEEDVGRHHKREKEGSQGGGSEQFKKLFTQNKGSPNFLLFFLLTYSPEFFPLACAYDLSAHNSERILEKYKDVFTTAKTTKLCAGYREVDENYLYDYSELNESGSKHSPGKSMNSLCTHACAVLKMVFQHKTKEPTELLDMARKKSPEIIWLVENLNDYMQLPSVHLDMGDKLFHWDAACYYQQIFDADVNLCIMNQRSKKNPLDDVVIFRKPESLKAGPNTPSKMASSPLHELLNRFSGSPNKNVTKKVRSSSSQKRRATMRKLSGTHRLSTSRQLTVRA